MLSSRSRFRSSILFVVCLLTSPRVLAKQTADFWPSSSGRTWTMEAHIGAKKFTQSVTVRSLVPESDGARYFLDYRSGAALIQTESYLVSARGVSRFYGGRADNITSYSPPLPVLQYPLAPGSKWYWTGTITAGAGGKPSQASAAWSASTPETVPLATGAVSALRVHMDLTVTVNGKRSIVQDDTWYAKGIGPVRQRTSVGRVTVDSVMISLPVTTPETGSTKGEGKP